MTRSPRPREGTSSAGGRDLPLVFLPLGGAGEIGLNLYLYGLGDEWLMVDCGVSFADETMPGVDLLMADPGFIAERRTQLRGLVLTHAHEDHIGAVAALWPRLDCPVWATPFTAAVLRSKLDDTDFADRIRVIEVPEGGNARIGPFGIRFIPMTHSIPEMSALAITTPHGTVLHTGDWKLDDAPQVGRLTDVATLKRLGEEGVLALVGDSTNAPNPGRSGSEATAAEALATVIARQPNRVAVTCFSSNVARIRSIALAAHAADRQVALVGRSLWRIVEAARATGYLDDLPQAFLREDEIGYVPRERACLICTGSQGEARSALSRIAADDHPNIVLEPGDTVIFSAREIPGNEKAIAAVQNGLIRQGVTVLTPDDAPVHVSGHAARDEIAELYGWVRPRIAIPMHGEERHLRAHAEIAREAGVEQAVVARNGAMVRLAPGPVEIVDIVPTGRLALDGARLIRLDGDVLQSRRRMIWNGAAMVTLVLDRRGLLASEPRVTLIGIEDRAAAAETEQALAEDVRDAVEALSRDARRVDAEVEEAARTALRRSVRQWSGKRPVTEIHVVRI